MPIIINTVLFDRAMRSLRIGIDVDGVVTEIIEPIVKFLYGRGIKVPSYEDTTDYNLSKVWRCSTQEMVRRVFDFYASKEFLELQPVLGVAKAFARLFPPHEGYSITSRPDIVENITKDFFDRYLNGRCREIHHLGEFGGNGSKETKGSLAKKLKLDFFVEDALHNAEEIASHGVPVLLMTQPWNRDRIVPQGVIRVNSWSDVLRYVEDYK